MRRRGEQTPVVTTAGRSRSDDIDLRQRRYVRTQLGRVACIGLGVLLPAPVWVRLLFFVGALALPWFGVVMANAGPVVQRGAGLEPVVADEVLPSTARVIDAAP